MRDGRRLSGGNSGQRHRHIKKHTPGPRSTAHLHPASPHPSSPPACALLYSSRPTPRIHTSQPDTPMRTRTRLVLAAPHAAHTAAPRNDTDPAWACARRLADANAYCGSSVCPAARRTATYGTVQARTQRLYPGLTPAMHTGGLPLATGHRLEGMACRRARLPGTCQVNLNPMLAFALCCHRVDTPTARGHHANTKRLSAVSAAFCAALSSTTHSSTRKTHAAALARGRVHPRPCHAYECVMPTAC